MNIKIDPSWKQVLESEFKKPYFNDLVDFVKTEYKTKTVFPHPKELFRAFNLCQVDKTKVVILGQDPYHGPNQANGMCFSVNSDVPYPPSLQNIYKEIAADTGKESQTRGDLEPWAKQGILLLNATLTVRANEAGSHQNKGWEVFTDAVISTLSLNKEHLVFLLWGSYAQKKGSMIDKTRHLVLEAPHPSPLSAHRGFLGCHHFSQTNIYLQLLDKDPIEW